GTDFAGGAETSLRTIAEALHQAGHYVEVFTTCTRQESNWSDEHAEGSVVIHDIPVHRHRLDPHDVLRHSEIIQTVLRANGAVGRDIEAEYLRTSIHSARLLEKLRQRADEFDAMIVGPYLFGLTVDVARAFPDKTILLPCLHDEPLARLQSFREVYENVGGILYHSPEEQRFAQADLGLNHPGATCIGTVIDTAMLGDGERGRQLVGTGRRYLVYCGRYIPQKGVDTLCEFAWRYHQRHPDRFTFAFMGQGNLPIPAEPWARDLGFVDESDKRDVLAGADAMVLLSRLESLSLVALEAWTQGVPVVADAGSEVLAGHLQRSGGGRTVDGFEAFAEALDDLWENPPRWQALGSQGQKYVQNRFGSRQDFTQTLVEAIRSLHVPLVERLREQGRRRAAQFNRPQWREQLGQLLEEILDAPARPLREEVEVRPRSSSRSAPAGAKSVLVPVRVVNRGTHVLAHQGPARWVLHTRMLDDLGRPLTISGAITPLSSLVPPGRALSVAVAVPVLDVPGTYQVGIRAERADGVNANNQSLTEGWVTMIVTAKDGVADQRCCAPMLEAAQTALAEAERVRLLPDDYLDVTEGWFAKWKRRIKRKLLNNFKKAYVDVVSRQQSAFNRQALTALIELADCCATLDHVRTIAAESAGNEPRARALPAVGSLQALVEQTMASGDAKDVAALVEFLVERLSESEQQFALLEQRLARLEARLPIKEEIHA
ncbi:MAG TPA: glycosyltransferase family 4 protein, partial [Gemmataceae bacterium]|nr:glycosyltransferase family 4 protein [Gemmataceae bacterium]